MPGLPPGLFTAKPMQGGTNMGSSSGVAMRYKPDLSAMVYALFSALTGKARPISIVTNEQYWVRIIGLVRVLELERNFDNPQFSWNWYGHAVGNGGGAYLHYVSFFQSSTIPAFARRDMRHLSVDVLVAEVLPNLLGHVDKDGKDIEKDIGAVEMELPVQFLSIADMNDSLETARSEVHFICSGHKVKALSLGIFHLYDSPSTQQLLWVGEVQVDDRKRHAIAYLDSTLSGTLKVLRP